MDIDPWGISHHYSVMGIDTTCLCFQPGDHGISARLFVGLGYGSLGVSGFTQVSWTRHNLFFLCCQPIGHGINVYLFMDHGYGTMGVSVINLVSWAESHLVFLML